jgi:hypothetical protein
MGRKSRALQGGMIMRIYFEDGTLSRPSGPNYQYDYIVDAREGYARNMRRFNAIKNLENDAIVYTNSLVALDNRFAWNSELGVPEVYLVVKDKFVRIDQLTDRKLKEGHNLMNLYIAGEFKNDT